MILIQRARAAAFCAFAVILLFASTASAQFTGVQYGARGFSDAPAGTQAFSLTYDRTTIGIGLNPDTQSSIDTTSQAVFLSYTRYFDLGGKTASILVSIPYVSLESTINTGCCGSFPGLSADGITDPYFQFNYPLIGGDTKSPEEFFRTVPGFALTFHTGLRVPLGKYDSSSPLNVAANRAELRLGLPMSYTWGTPTKQTSIEFIPVVYVFSDNKDPFGAGRLAQGNAYQFEFHLTHDFSPMFWGSVNLLHAKVGETTTDGVPGNNEFEYTGGGFTIAARLSRSMSASMTYGVPLKTKFGSNDGNQFKFGVTYTF